MTQWILGLVLVSVASLSAYAVPMPVIKGATVTAQSQEIRTQHRIALSKARKISGQLALDRELMVTGELSKQSFELDPQDVMLDVFNQQLSEYQKSGSQLIYRCEGRDCGSSNLWANSLFNNARLYGLDDQQAYAVLRNNDVLVALYGVVRGNRRAYLQIEHITSQEPLGEVLPESATLTYQLMTQDLLSLGLDSEPQEAWVSLLAASLRRQVTIRAAVGGPFAALWRDALVAKGVNTSRLGLADEQSDFLYLKRLR